MAKAYDPRLAFMADMAEQAQAPAAPLPGAPQAKRVPIKNGRGAVTGWLTLYWSAAAGWVSCP